MCISHVKNEQKKKKNSQLNQPCQADGMGQALPGFHGSTRGRVCHRAEYYICARHYWKECFGLARTQNLSERSCKHTRCTMRVCRRGSRWQISSFGVHSKHGTVHCLHKASSACFKTAAAVMAGALTGSVHSTILSSQLHGRSRACSRLHSRVNFAPRLRSRFVVRAQGETNDEISDLTGEWPANWSLASYEDVGAFFQDNLFKDDTSPGTHLSDVMSINLTTVTADTSIEQAKVLFRTVTGLPVVKSATDKTLVGVVSKKDLNKPGTTVRDIMSTPPIAARPTNKVAEAACLMLKHKVHRIPVVDNQAQVVGIVTRTDIFTAMALEAGNTELLTNA